MLSNVCHENLVSSGYGKSEFAKHFVVVITIFHVHINILILLTASTGTEIIFVVVKHLLFKSEQNHFSQGAMP